MKHYKLLLILLFPLTLILGGYLIVYKKPIFIISEGIGMTKDDMNSSSYNDESSMGNSQMSLIRNPDGTFQYVYTLKEGFTFPYVGILFQRKDSSLIDLSAYNSVRVKVRASKGTRIPLTLTTFDSGFSNPNVPFSFRNSQGVLTVNEGYTDLSMSLKDFETPDWWYTATNKTENGIKYKKGPTD